MPGSRLGKPRYQLRRKYNQIEVAIVDGAALSSTEVQRSLDPLIAQLPHEAERASQLIGLVAGTGSRADYQARYGWGGVRLFQTSAQARIYQLAVETFADHVNNVYLICDERSRTLYDCGSHTSGSRAELARASQMLTRAFSAPGLHEVTDVVVSHAHIDHFGGVGHFAGRARIFAHEFDARVVSRFEERVVQMAMQLRVFLERAGVDADTRAELEQMYVFSKQLYKSVPVTRMVQDGEAINGHTLFHVPGHCPGQVCLQVHNVLLTADHVLPRITPHQSPESITPWTGLDHYFRSLQRVATLPGIDLALPGHEEPIADLRTRIVEIERFHRARLDKVRAACATPLTTVEITQALFGQQSGYGRLLALEEAAAHIEYLQRRGWLEIANLEELASAPNPVLAYRALGT